MVSTKKMFFGVSIVFFLFGCASSKFIESFEKDSNIYVKQSNGETTQLTFKGADSNPLISKDQKLVYFIRNTGNMGSAEFEGVEQKAIMEIDIKSLVEKKIADEVRYSDRKFSNELYFIKDLSISKDGLHLFFIAPKWVTSDVLVKLNTKTGKITEISPGYKFELLKSGQFEGHIIIKRSFLKENVGRILTNLLIDIEGNILKDIGGDDALKTFRNNFN